MKVFYEKQLKEQEKLLQNPDRDEQIDAYNLQKDTIVNNKVLKSVAHMYLQTLKVAKRYQEEHQHTLYFTPVFYLRVFKTFTRLLEERKRNVKEIQKRYEEGLDKIRSTVEAIQDYHTELEKKTP